MKHKLCLYTPPFPWVNSYFQMIDLAVEYGLDAVEGFNCFELAQPDVRAAEQIRAYADKKGICFPCLSVYADLGGEDGPRQTAMLKEYAYVAAALGSPLLHHTIVPQHVTPESVIPDREVLYRRGLAAVRDVFDFANQLGVKAVYEDQGYIFNGVQGFRNFLTEVDRQVGVVIDLGNIYQVDETPYGFIETFAESTDHVHIKDVRYFPNGGSNTGALGTLHGASFDIGRPGEGSIDIKACIAAIKDSGYKGSFALEFSAGPGGADALREYVRQLRAWIEE